MKAPIPLVTCGLLLAVAHPVTAQQNRLTTYGFFDTEFEASNRDPNNLTTTFDQHHFNVVTIYRLADEWQVFGEIEWEHGAALESDGGTGEVVLERAWVQYAPSDAFKIKVGKFLTPFGYYNLFHDATPTFLSSFLPSAIYGSHGNPLGDSQRMYSKFGTGVQVLGTVLTGGWQADYFAYVTNGRGPSPFDSDIDQDKGFGGRVMLQSPREDFRIGVSYYQDDNGNAAQTRQQTVAADVGFGAAGLWLDVEGFLPRLENVDALGAPNNVFRSGLGYYVQASYRSAVGITPFARYDFFDPDTDIDSDGDSDIVLGLNIALMDFAFFKSEVQMLSFEDPATDSYEKFVFSIAVAF